MADLLTSHCANPEHLLKDGRVYNPSETYHFADAAEWQDTIMTDVPSQTIRGKHLVTGKGEGAAPRHSGKANMIFTDGQAESMLALSWVLQTAQSYTASEWIGIE